MNPYFLNPQETSVEIGDNIYFGTIFDYPLTGQKAIELKFQTEENYNDFAETVIYKKSGMKLKMYILDKIAGTCVMDKKLVVGEILSHNSDFFKATYLYG